MRSSLPKTMIVVGLAGALLALGACGTDTATPSTSSSPGSSATPSPSSSPSATPTKVKASTNLDAIAVSGEYGQSPKVTFKAPWGIDKTRTKVVIPGNGAEIKDGQSVELNYYGINARTGKKFDDSYSRKQTASFNLDQVVPGFKKGLVGQKQGSRVVIAMPGTDGYDASGGNPQIGVEVGDTLIFVVDVVAVPLTGPKGEAVAPKAGLPTVADKDGVPTVTVPKTDAPTSLVVQPLIKGTGKKVAATDTITINYTWVRWSDGSVVEQTYKTKPASAPLAQLITGLQKGLVDQTVGSRVLLVVPPADGYPQGNATPKIDTTETLVLVVDILFTEAGQ